LKQEGRSLNSLEVNRRRQKANHSTPLHYLGQLARKEMNLCDQEFDVRITSLIFDTVDVKSFHNIVL